MNELLFLAAIILVSSAALAALKFGKEALITLIGVQWVLANLFVTKQITLFGFEATASDALAVGATLCLNLVQEYFGKKYARKAIAIGFGSTLFYSALAFMQLMYLPSTLDNMHPHFCALLAPMPRLIVASMTTYLIVQWCDYKLYGLLKNISSLTLRNYISVGSTQLLDTILFSFLGLYGLVSPLGSIIMVSYGIKVAVILLAAPFISMSRYITIDQEC